eukprot:scaffold15944_cov248-Ochromonas_danica.AAC.16
MSSLSINTTTRSVTPQRLQRKPQPQQPRQLPLPQKKQPLQLPNRGGHSTVTTLTQSRSQSASKIPRHRQQSATATTATTATTTAVSLSLSSDTAGVVVTRKRKSVLLFHDLRVDSVTLQLLPLILCLEKRHSKEKHRSLYSFFDIWKRWVHPMLIISPRHHHPPQTPLLDYPQLYGPASDSEEMIVYEQPDVQARYRLSHALQIISKACDRIKEVKAQSTSSMKPLQRVWKAWRHWQKWTRGCARLAKVIPIPLRVLLMLHHGVLWKVFSSYCSNHRIRSTSSSSSLSPLPSGSHHLLLESTSHLDSPERGGGSSTIEGEGSPNGRISFSTKPLLTRGQVWSLLRDCGLSPLHLGRRRFEVWVDLLQETSIRNIPESSVNFFSPLPHSLVSSGSGAGLLGSSSPSTPSGACSPQQYRTSRASSPSLGSRRVDEENLEDMISLDLFVKVMWRLCAELLELSPDRVSNNLPALRQALRAIENKSVNWALRTIGGQVDGWQRFVAQHTAKTPFRQLQDPSHSLLGPIATQGKESFDGWGGFSSTR